MRKLVKSMVSFSWSMTLLGARTMTRIVTGRPGDSASGLDAVSKAAEEQLDGPLKSVYETADRIQSEIVDGIFGGGPTPDPGTVPKRRFDEATFVVLGDGLAAGMGHFSLTGSAQATSFPAHLAKALRTPFEQPLFQAPGVGDVVGLESQKPILPSLQQSTVRASLPSEANLGNLSVPGFSVGDAISLRPRAPLIDRDSNLQTVTNLILGLPELMVSPRGPSQLEYAGSRRPTLALVCHGYDQILAAAAAGDTRRLPSGPEFQRDYHQLLVGLGPAPMILATTIPDPLDSAYFSTLDTAALILKTTPEFLQQHYGLNTGDLVHLPGLYDIGYQMMARKVGALERPPAIDAETVDAIRTTVSNLNAAVRSVATALGAEVFDLHGLLADVAHGGLEVAGKKLTADYLGGLYQLNGSYPGATLNARIADEMVTWINRTFNQAFDGVGVEGVAASDANTLTELAPGSAATDAFLKPRTEAEIPQFAPIPEKHFPPVPIQTTYPDQQPGKEGCVPDEGMPAEGISDPSYDSLTLGPKDFTPLKLPEELEMTVDINTELSFFGDALRPVDCPGEPQLIPNFPPMGLCEDTFFGGLGLLPTTSQLSGKIHVKFSPPDENNVTHFEISHPGGLFGDEGDLGGAMLFKMPIQHTMVQDLPGFQSTGVLNLNNGQVTNFHYNVQNINTALHSLLKLNPGLLPNLMAGMVTFPGVAPNTGSSWAEFTQKSDGSLDVSLAGNMIVPLGLESANGPVRFPLPFTTPDLGAASFVARGTQVHPRMHVTSKPSPPAVDAAQVPQIPFNTLQELTCFTRSTCFGDAFDLHAPELGEGGATGRSQLLCRALVQFGPRTGDTAPVLFRLLPPGGLLNDTPIPPPFLPPGSSRAASGFDAIMRFPKQTYPQSGLSSADDPYIFAASSIHLETGELVAPLLWRGFVVQELFADLIQVEPCTPSAAFNYQGPARFSRDAHGQTVLHWNASVYIPYPKGFKFPSPNPGGRPPFVIQGDSRLDPFRRVQAMHRGGRPRHGVMSGGEENVLSSNEQTFSYRYSIPCDPAHASEARFEYINHTHGGSFCLTSLAWIDCTNSVDSAAPDGRADILTFTGFGTWSEDAKGGLHFVSVQISQAAHAPYVGIQVDGGPVSNVDTKPAQAQIA